MVHDRSFDCWRGTLRAYAGREFALAGRRFSILEKSRGVGGRVATRRTEERAFDHGAQFYKVDARHPYDLFWQEANVAKTWFTKRGETYRASPGGLTKIAKSLMVPDTIELNRRVIGLVRLKDHWQVMIEDGASFESRQVILTAPLPQSLDLLKSANVTPPAGLTEMAYAPAIVGLVSLSSGLELVYVQSPNADIFSIANQRSKEVSAEEALTVTMSPEWSAAHFALNDSELATKIELALKSQVRASIIDIQIKKWRYAHPLRTWTAAFAQVAEDLYLAGDAFGGASVNGAVFSGCELAHFI